jgi:hypothetical protein
VLSLFRSPFSTWFWATSKSPHWLFLFFQCLNVSIIKVSVLGPLLFSTCIHWETSPGLVTLNIIPY